MSNQEVLICLLAAALAAAGVVAGLSIAGAGTAALYAAAFGATVLVCGLEYLRRVAGHG